jgi:hypothetical protein
MGNVFTICFSRLDGWDRLESMLYKRKEKKRKEKKRKRKGMLVDPDQDTLFWFFISSSS